MDIVFERMTGNAGDLGVITLNRPAALNALTKDMIHALHDHLKTWEDESTIKAVVIRAAPGRAFCAGGDIRQVYDAMRIHSDHASDFFRDEYELNRKIFHYRKPYIAFLDGITMGGGAGVSLHGSHVVGTERLVFAMPETGIGFFPDVGGTYFLPRLPAFFGYYLGLTGAKIHSHDCRVLQLIQHTVSSNALEPLLQALANTAFGEDARAHVTMVINQYQHPAGVSKLYGAHNEIAACFDKQSMEDIMHALHETDEVHCQSALEMLKQKSPLSLKVTLAALQRGEQLDFDQCMQREYLLTQHFIASGEFQEGIRAVLVDKDQTPHWNPATLEAVTSGMVERFFS